MNLLQNDSRYPLGQQAKSESRILPLVEAAWDAARLMIWSKFRVGAEIDLKQ